MQDAQSTLPLDDQLDACHEQFLLHFVGHSPLTRDVAMLEALISEMEHLVKAADGAKAQVAAGRLEDYRKERDAIAQAQAEVGPHARAIARQFQQAGFVLHRYTRHFAGQPRGTRDAGLLAEMNGDLQAVQANLLALKAPDETRDPVAEIDSHAQRLMDERAAVLLARREGSLADQAVAWAGAANTLFATYNALAVGQSRLVVRPELLRRLITDLEHILAELRKLRDEGLEAPDHDANTALVEKQLSMWQEEHKQTLDVRRQSTPDELLTALNQAMDAVLTDYNDHVAGRDMGTTELLRLIVLCDRMDEIERQLSELIPMPTLKQARAHNAVSRDVLALLVGAFNHFAKKFAEAQ